MLNYENLIKNNPTVYDEMINSLEQKITFVEHPTKGDEVPIICICHELKLASYSDFFELDDMLAGHKEYEPVFICGDFQHGV
ncbi:hypothetical protein SAMN05444481_13624 [Flavobacterium frigidimaris]|nr:hypothetical protein SAMN05444481_13624 [Flavobacterium frigidimaris]